MEATKHPADIIPPPERVLPRLVYHRRQVVLLEKQLKLSKERADCVDIDRDDCGESIPPTREAARHD